jgi:hypothetical protein
MKTNMIALASGKKATVLYQAASAKKTTKPVAIAKTLKPV